MQDKQNPLRLLWAFLRPRLSMLGLLLLLSTIVAAVLYAWHTPLEALGYAALLCLVPALASLGYAWMRHSRRHKGLLRLQQNISNAMDQLPAPRDVIEQDYQDLLKAMRAEHRAAANRADARYAHLSQYYTLWGHQIKTPIAAMRLLLQKEDTPFSRQLGAELFRVEQYVEMALTYMRLDADVSDLLFQRLPLQNLARQAVRKYANLFVLKRLQLDMDIAADAVVLTDEKWFVFALEQLLSNAVKYTGQGGVRIAWDGPARTLSVCDSGIGIAQADLPRVFENGFTGYNGRLDKKSTGLGLSLCRAALQKIGHELSIASAPGQGTQAVITFAQQQVGGATSPM